jgi:hypothetical protein
MSTPKDTETDTQKRDPKTGSLADWMTNVGALIALVIFSYCIKDLNALQLAKLQTIALAMITWRVLHSRG